MSATMVCTGQMNATGTVETTFVDANTTKTTVHITGTMQMGQNSRPIDMTMQSTSTYKGADCGSVQPLAMPPSQVTAIRATRSDGRDCQRLDFRLRRCA